MNQAPLRSALTLLVLALAATGCSKSKHSPSPTGTPGGGCAFVGTSSQTVRCNFSTDNLCDQISGTMTVAECGALSSACGGGGGTFSMGTCSTTGAVSGHCHYADQSVLTSVPIAAGGTLDEYYYTVGWTLTTAQGYCATPPAGVWQ
jgi:hypothetical protein